jgi:hypothetical protein
VAFTIGNVFGLGLKEFGRRVAAATTPPTIHGVNGERRSSSGRTNRQVVVWSAVAP